MPTLSQTCLIIVDIQGKLAGLMHEKERLIDNTVQMIKGAHALQIPILWAEQNPKGLGKTLPAIADCLTGLDPIEKQAFSCCGSPEFMTALTQTGRKQVLLVGIETHVCVYQTARDLLAQGYEVAVVSDAVSSRTAENRALGLAAMERLGATLTSVEMALFDLLETAEAPAFKEILKIVK